MNKFRRLSNAIDSVLVDNFRTLQSTGNRRVYVRNINGRRTPLDAVKPLQEPFAEKDWFV